MYTGGVNAEVVNFREPIDELSAVEESTIAKTLDAIVDQNRRQLFEHEVYALVEWVGAISPPRHLFISLGIHVTEDMLAGFPGNRVVLKLVSKEVIHKSDTGGVLFVRKESGWINREMDRLQDEQTRQGHRIQGFLLVEFVEQASHGLGSELFVGIRASREFGPILAAGLGGVDTEYLASKMKPGLAAVNALALETSAQEFLCLFKKTAAYEILTGQVRGHKRVVSDDELLRCFRAFLSIARKFTVYRDDRAVGIVELEVNPFAFSSGRMIPLDGRGQLGYPARPTVQRPIHKIKYLLKPCSIAIAGVSSQRQNFGRIILSNVKNFGFPQEHLYVIKDRVERIDGVQCVRNIRSVPEPVDLLVAATSASGVLDLATEAIESGQVTSVILIPAGMGETQETAQVQQKLNDMILASRRRQDGGPIFLGGNSMGLRSKPGQYDTFFISPARLSPHRQFPANRVALISQSGAFMITRMSNLKHLDPAWAISVGNQIDLTLADLLQEVGHHAGIDCVGVYAEGFKDLDGLALVRITQELSRSGKIIVFYKAGRTEQGRSATQGHTASIAGDYEVCQAAMAHAGAIVVDTFKEFEQLLELATRLHHKQVRGRRIGVISNAGYETVGMADTIQGARYQLELPSLKPITESVIRNILHQGNLDSLINIRNPLDLTPMSDDMVYEGCIRVMLDSAEIDAVVVAIVPMTERLLTLPDQLKDAKSIANRLLNIFRQSPKPLILVLDSGEPYEAFAEHVRAGGIPVFCSCDQAIRSLGRYLCHQAKSPNPAQNS